MVACGNVTQLCVIFVSLSEIQNTTKSLCDKKLSHGRGHLVVLCFDTAEIRMMELSSLDTLITASLTRLQLGHAKSSQWFPFCSIKHLVCCIYPTIGKCV